MGREYEQVVYRSGNPKYLQVYKEMLTIVSNQRNANFKNMRYHFIFICLENIRKLDNAQC